MKKTTALILTLLFILNTSPTLFTSGSGPFVNTFRQHGARSRCDTLAPGSPLSAAAGKPSQLLLDVDRTENFLLEAAYNEAVRKITQWELELPEDFFGGFKEKFSTRQLKAPNGVNILLLNEMVSSLPLFLAGKDLAGANFFITPYPLKDLFYDQTSQTIFIQKGIYIDQSGRLCYGRFNKPVAIHAVHFKPQNQKELEEAGVPVLTHSKVPELTEDKLLIKKLLTETGIETPEWIAIHKGMNASEINDALTLFLEKDPEADFVVKPSNKFGGIGVRIFSGEDYSKEEVSLFIETLLLTSPHVLVEKRFKPIPVETRAGDPLDWNIRAIVTFNEDGLPVIAGMGVRMALNSSNPVNVTAGAEFIPFNRFLEMLSLSIPDRTALLESIQSVVASSAEKVQTALSHHSYLNQPLPIGLLGFDLMAKKTKDPQSPYKITVIEVNSGNVGGIDNLTHTLPQEEKLVPARIVADSLVRLAQTRRNIIQFRELPLENHFSFIPVSPTRRWLHTAISFIEAGQWNTADLALLVLLKYKENSVSALYLKGITSFELGKTQHAIRYLKRALELEPSHIEAMIQLGMIFGTRGQYKEALAVVKMGLALFPDHKELLQLMGAAYMEISEWEKAAEAYQKLSVIDPENPEVFFQYAETQRMLRRLGWAKLKLRRVLQLDPYHFDAWFHLGLLSEETGQPDHALSFYNQARVLDPTDPTPYAQIARLHYNNKDMNKALAILSAGAAEATDSAELHTIWGDLLFTLDRFKEAEEQFATAKALDQNNAHAIAGLGLVRHAQGNSLEAIPLFAEALEIDPTEPTALKMMDQVANATGGIPFFLLGSVENSFQTASFDSLESSL